MVRQDIISGLRNAMERGQSLEQARQTLLNSGYNSKDVLEAVNYLTGGLSSPPLQYISQQKLQNYQAMQATPQNIQSAQSTHVQQLAQGQYLRPSQNMQQVQPLLYVSPGMHTQKGKFPWGIFILSLILLVLVGILVSSLLFKDEIISFLESLLS